MTNWSLYGQEIPPEAKRCVFIHPDTHLPDCADDITIIRTDLVAFNHCVKTDDVIPYHYTVSANHDFESNEFRAIVITAFK